jgi:hypothetical protein
MFVPKIGGDYADLPVTAGPAILPIPSLLYISIDISNICKDTDRVEVIGVRDK